MSKLTRREFAWGGIVAGAAMLVPDVLSAQEEPPKYEVLNCNQLGEHTEITLRKYTVGGCSRVISLFSRRTGNEDAYEVSTYMGTPNVKIRVRGAKGKVDGDSRNDEFLVEIRKFPVAITEPEMLRTYHLGAKVLTTPLFIPGLSFAQAGNKFLRQEEIRRLGDGPALVQADETNTTEEMRCLSESLRFIEQPPLYELCLLTWLSRNDRSA